MCAYLPPGGFQTTNLAARVCRLIRKGEATVTPGGKNRHVFVFNDMCMVMKTQGNRYQTELLLELRGAKVQGMFLSFSRCLAGSRVGEAM